MIWIIVLLVLALLLAAATYVLFAGLPDSRTASGKRVKFALLGLTVCLVFGIGLSVAILVQEETGMVTGLSGGLESDARQWVSRNATTPPQPDQAGDNIRILHDGISFINSHPSVAETAEATTLLQQYSNLPARPTRLLTRQEESQYYEGARSVYRLISSLAEAETASGE